MIESIATFLLALFVLSLPAVPTRGADGDEDVIDPGAVKPTRTVEYKRIGDTSLVMHLFLPEGHKPGEKRPGIIFFHGGAWVKGDPSQFFPQAEYLASRGMVAMSAQYRLIGKNGETIDGCIADAASAMRWARANAEELGLDPDRLAASGGSAGGHLAAVMAVLPGLDEGAAEQGVSSKPNLLVLFNPALFHKKAQQTLNLDQFTAQTPPMLFLCGTRDEMFAYGVDVKNQAREQGNEVVFLGAEGAGHGFFNRPPWYEPTVHAMHTFLARHGYLAEAPAPLEADAKLHVVEAAE